MRLGGYSLLGALDTASFVVGTSHQHYITRCIASLAYGTAHDRNILSGTNTKEYLKLKKRNLIGEPNKFHWGHRFTMYIGSLVMTPPNMLIKIKN